MWKDCLAGIPIASVLFLAGPARGQLVASHAGATDPTTDGWIQAGGGGVGAGPITDDLGLGIDAWFVDDDSTGGGSTLGYRVEPTMTQISDGDSLGWKLIVILRVVDSVVELPDSSIIVEYGGGAHTTYTMDFGLNALAEPIVQLATGVTSVPHLSKCKGDIDGDGLVVPLDECPHSDLSPTIIIGGEDTGVANDLLAGCTIADLIAQLLAADASTNELVLFLVELRGEGVLSGQELGAILQALNTP